MGEIIVLDYYDRSVWIYKLPWLNMTDVFIRAWLADNLKNYKEEFLSILDSEIDTEGEISNDNITDLLDNEEFIAEFEQYLND